MGKSTKSKLPSNPKDVNPTVPRAHIDDVIDEPPTPGPPEEDMDDVDYESEPEPEPISLPKPHAKAVAYVGPISPKGRATTAAIPRSRLLCVTRTRIPHIESTTRVHRNIVNSNALSFPHSSLSKQSDQTSLTA
jgi:hypothetical protein